MVDFVEKWIRRRITGLRDYRKFTPTDRQSQLFQALLRDPCPPDEDDPGGGDRLTLLGYGGAMGGGKKHDDLLDADRYMHELLQQVPPPGPLPTFRLHFPARGQESRPPNA